MKTKALLMLLILIGALTLITNADAQVRIHPVSSHYHYLDVDVWMDQPEGSVYYPGENIEIFFRANRAWRVIRQIMIRHDAVMVLVPTPK